MIVLRANAWQLPLLTISYGVKSTTDTTIGAYYGSEVAQFAKAYALASLSPLNGIPNYSGTKVSLNTGGVPFFPDLGIVNVSNAGRVFDLPLTIRVGSKKITATVDGTNSGIFKRDILSQYLLAAIQVEFIQARAKKEGIGLGTKERYQLNQAKSEMARLGSKKIVWASSCEAPMLLNDNGLSIRATTTYCPYASTVQLVSGSASGLKTIVASHKSEMIAYYKQLFPSATTTMIQNALDDAGISNWYETEFLAYVIPSRASRSVLKSPLLRQLETYGTSEAYAFATSYLTQVVGKAVTDADISALQNEFFVALKRKGHKIAKSKIPEARLVFADAVKAVSGYEGEMDFTSVITGSARWSEFARSVNQEGADFHPLLWSNVDFDGSSLSGTSPNGKSCSVDVPPYLYEFAALLGERRDVVLLLIRGWEDFVASTYSASFSDFKQTTSTFVIKTFRPLFQSCGVNGSMSPNEIIGMVE